jgi:hypothetical protein
MTAGVVVGVAVLVVGAVVVVVGGAGPDRGRSASMVRKSRGMPASTT